MSRLSCRLRLRGRRQTRERGGRPWKIYPGRDARRVCPPQARHLVVSVACQAEQERDLSGFSHDSVGALARLVAGRGDIITMSPATVQRISAEMVRPPPRFRSWLTRTEPGCERKMEGIGNLDLAPPRSRRLRCVDENTGIQALERRYPTLPLRPGQLERREFASRRHGVVDLRAAFDVRTGQVFGQGDWPPTHLEFRHFLRTLRARDPDRRWQRILDNARSHPTHEGLEWCAAPRPKIPLPW